MFGFGKKSGPTIGLDINSSTISLLQLEKTKTDIKVSRFSSILTPPDVVREGLLADPEAVGQAVRELLDMAGMPVKGATPRANISLPGQAVVIRLLPVPKGMPGEELTDVVRQEAINNLPFPIDEANLDWVRVPGTTRMDPDAVEREDILLAATQRTTADSYWQMAEVAGIEIARLEISSLAIIRALSFAGMIGQESGLSLLVNIRQDATDITLVDKVVPLFSRSVLFGVESVVDTMARAINGTAKEAADFVPQVKLIGVPTADPRLSQAAQAARSICGDLTAELGRSLDFYMSQVGMVTVDQVILSGPGTAIGEVDQFIASRLNLKTVVANPFQGLVYDREQILDDRRSYHAALIGLIVDADSTENKTVAVNLNQSEPQGDEADAEGEPVVEEVDTPWFVPALAGGGALAVILLAVMLYFQCLVIPGKDQEAAALEEQITETKKKIESMTKQQDELAPLEQRKTALEKVVNHGTPMTVLMKAVQENTPDGVRVVSMNLEGLVATIIGKSTSFAKSSYMAINLEGSNLFSAMDISYVKRLKKFPQQINFQLTAIFANDLDKKTVDNPVSSIGANGNNQATGASLSSAAGNLASGSPAVAGGRAKVLDFYATWCLPCQRMKPFMEQAQHKYGGQMEFVAIDIDDPNNKALVTRYGIRSVPNVFFLDAQGNVVQHLKGFGGSGEEIFSACDKLRTVASKATTK